MEKINRINFMVFLAPTKGALLHLFNFWERDIFMKYRYQKTNYSLYAAILIVGLIIGLSLGLLIYYQTPIVETTFYKESVKPFYSEMNLLAVDQDGNGVSTPLTVELKPGEGRVLTDIDKLLFWIDTQYSIQTARDVAVNITKINMDDYDLIYSINSEATVVGGPSAGAALTIATVAALENKTLRDNIVITGTIEPDGSIGEVGGILEKAKAAKDIGADIFIVPLGQGEETYLKPQENCVRRGGFIFCETAYKQITVNIGEEIGISVLEVGNIRDALKYFGL